MPQKLDVTNVESLISDQLFVVHTVIMIKLKCWTKSDIDTSAYNKQQQFPYLLIVELHIDGWRNVVNS